MTASSLRCGPAILLAIAALSLLAIAAALISQYVFDMQPCPWCILQRVIFLAVAAVALVGWALGRRWRPVRSISAGLVVLLGAAGVAAAVYQHRVASKLFSCDLTMADRFLMATGLEDAVPFLFRVTASCADAAVTLLGVSYELWSGTLFALIGLAGIWLLRPDTARRR